MRSARRSTIPVVALLACAPLLAGAAAGCQTTQETATLRRAEAKRILAARKQKHEQRKQHARDHEKEGRR